MSRLRMRTGWISESLRTRRVVVMDETDDCRIHSLSDLRWHEAAYRQAQHALLTSPSVWAMS